MNLWQKDEAVKRFVFEQQFAQVAADLLGVEKVRLYHDQALFKEPGGGHTPWHQDKGVAPASGDGVVVQKNLILKGLPARLRKASGTLLNTEGSPFPADQRSHATTASIVLTIRFRIK